MSDLFAGEFPQHFLESAIEVLELRAEQQRLALEAETSRERREILALEAEASRERTEILRAENRALFAELANKMAQARSNM
jgi:hypothetical protein